eukprot:scaffold7740_cov112-Isochrysis_galbana.AAC.4
MDRRAGRRAPAREGECDRANAHARPVGSGGASAGSIGGWVQISRHQRGGGAGHPRPAQNLRQPCNDSPGARAELKADTRELTAQACDVGCEGVQQQERVVRRLVDRLEVLAVQMRQIRKCTADGGLDQWRHILQGHSGLIDLVLRARPGPDKHMMPRCRDSEWKQNA